LEGVKRILWLSLLFHSCLDFFGILYCVVVYKLMHVFIDDLPVSAPRALAVGSLETTTRGGTPID